MIVARCPVSLLREILAFKRDGINFFLLCCSHGILELQPMVYARAT